MVFAGRRQRPIKDRPARQLPASETMEELLSTPDAARVLGMKPSALENWRWKGRGPPFVRVTARAIRYRREDLERFIKERLRRSTSDPGPATV